MDSYRHGLNGEEGVAWASKTYDNDKFLLTSWGEISLLTCDKQPSFLLILMFLTAFFCSLAHFLFIFLLYPCV